MQEDYDHPPLEYIDDIVKHIFSRQTSTFIMGFGRRESGKTDFSLLIMEILFRANLIKCFATNIKVAEAPFTVEHIITLPELEGWAKIGAEKKLFILDEAGKSLRRRTPMAKLNIELLDNLQILRKYKLSIIMLAPADKYIDAASLGSDILDGYFIKPYFRNPKVAIYHDLLEDFHRTLSDIPSTTLKFDTWDIAPFSMNARLEMQRFDNKELDILSRWCNGTPWNQLTDNPIKLNRIVRRFVKRVLDSKDVNIQTLVGVNRRDNGLQTKS